MKILTGHGSKETAFEIKNYPWGYTLKTSMFVWIETAPKKGDRVMRQTINPKTGRLCKPAASTYAPIMWLYMDENGHVKSDGISIYTDRAKITAAIEAIGIENLNAEQKKQYNQLLGINEVKVDEFTGAIKKDYSVKWERDIIGAGWKDGKWNKGEPGKCREVRITFDRPDGVKLSEVFKAMKGLNQDRLNEVFEVVESKNFGSYPGTVRICVRGGMQLTTVPEETYKNWLASDANTIEEDMNKGKYQTQIF